MNYFVAFAVMIMVLESAHVVCPILLTWTNPGLRSLALREWRRFICLPALLCGLIWWPFAGGTLYFCWNIYHFGMQNFGVWQLVRPTDYDGRIKRGIVCLGSAALGMGILPFFFPYAWVFVAGTILFGFTHWLTDIWLSGRAARGWWFTGAVLTFGLVWLLLRSKFGPLWSGKIPEIVLIRNCTLGFTHFVYSARIWKLSDPQVRMALGRDVDRPLGKRLFA